MQFEYFRVVKMFNDEITEVRLLKEKYKKEVFN